MSPPSSAAGMENTPDAQVGSTRFVLAPESSRPSQPLQDPAEDTATAFDRTLRDLASQLDNIGDSVRYALHRLSPEQQYYDAQSTQEEKDREIQIPIYCDACTQTDDKPAKNSYRDSAVQTESESAQHPHSNTTVQAELSSDDSECDAVVYVGRRIHQNIATVTPVVKVALDDLDTGGVPVVRRIVNKKYGGLDRHHVETIAANLRTIDSDSDSGSSWMDHAVNQSPNILAAAPVFEQTSSRINRAADYSPDPLIDQAAGYSPEPFINQAADYWPLSSIDQAADYSPVPLTNASVVEQTTSFVTNPYETSSRYSVEEDEHAPTRHCNTFVGPEVSDHVAATNLAALDPAILDCKAGPPPSNRVAAMNLAALDPAILDCKAGPKKPKNPLRIQIPKLHPDWNELKVLKRGAQGRVCIVKHAVTSERRVNKEMDLNALNRYLDDYTTSTEHHFLKNLASHTNIVKLRAEKSRYSPDRFCFVQELQYELCDEGDLTNYIKYSYAKCEGMHRVAVAHIFQSMLSALAYLHLGQIKRDGVWREEKKWCRQAILHRDIKPDNIFLRGPGRNAMGLPDVVLGDFGLAAFEGDKTIVGTLAFAAPEVDAAFKARDQNVIAFLAETARRPIITTASDAFSLGATVFSAMTGREYYLFDEELLMNSDDGKVPKETEGESGGYPNILWTYIEGLLRPSARQRSPSKSFPHLADELERRTRRWTP